MRDNISSEISVPNVHYVWMHTGIFQMLHILFKKKNTHLCPTIPNDEQYIM